MEALTLSTQLSVLSALSPPTGDSLAYRRGGEDGGVGRGGQAVSGEPEKRRLGGGYLLGVTDEAFKS